METSQSSLDTLYRVLDPINRELRKIIPPVYFLVALLLMFILGYFMPLSHLIYVPLRVFGSLMAILGIAVTVWGANSFSREGTPIKPFERATTLVRNGIYCYSRNPMYLGMLVTLTGTWIALGTFSPLLVIPVFFYIIQEAFIKHEEKMLEETFPDEFRDYRDKVRRWF